MDLHKFGASEEVVTICLDHCDENRIKCVENIPLTCEEQEGNSCNFFETCEGEYIGDPADRCCSGNCVYGPIVDPTQCTEMCFTCPESTPLSECLDWFMELQKSCYIVSCGYGTPPWYPADDPMDPSRPPPPLIREKCAYIVLDAASIIQDCVAHFYR